MKNRAGDFIMHPSGYKTFLPNDLPPKPPIEFDGEMLALLSEAYRKLGRLYGVMKRK